MAGQTMNQQTPITVYDLSCSTRFSLSGYNPNGLCHPPKRKRLATANAILRLRSGGRGAGGLGKGMAVTKRARRSRGFGAGLPFDCRDVDLIRRAIRERWPIPAARRTAIIEELIRVGSDDDSSLHLKTSCLTALMEMKDSIIESLLKQPEQHNDQR